MRSITSPSNPNINRSMCIVVSTISLRAHEYTHRNHSITSSPSTTLDQSRVESRRLLISWEKKSQRCKLIITPMPRNSRCMLEYHQSDDCVHSYLTRVEHIRYIICKVIASLFFSSNISIRNWLRNTQEKNLNTSQPLCIGSQDDFFHFHSFISKQKVSVVRLWWILSSILLQGTLLRSNILQMILICSMKA